MIIYLFLDFLIVRIYCRVDCLKRYLHVLEVWMTRLLGLYQILLQRFTILCLLVDTDFFSLLRTHLFILFKRLNFDLLPLHTLRDPTLLTRSFTLLSLPYFSLIFFSLIYDLFDPFFPIWIYLFRSIHLIYN
jgi:hypothetical protein